MLTIQQNQELFGSIGYKMKNSVVQYVTKCSDEYPLSP